MPRYEERTFTVRDGIFGELREFKVRDRIDSRVARVVDLPDWDLVVIFNHGSRTPTNVSCSIQYEIRRAVWARQDGYGQAGYTPAQGWDWSGIRDSSQEACAEMARAIRATLAVENIAVLEWDERSQA